MKTKEVTSNKKPDWKYYITTFIAVIGLIISACNYFTLIETKPLRYSVNVEAMPISEDVIQSSVEILVSNGAVGDLTFVNYKDGIIIDRHKKIAGKITKNSSKTEKTFKFELVEENENPDTYLLTQYMLVNGLDGSVSLDLILYHIERTPTEGKVISVNTYSMQDLALLEISEDRELYQKAIKDYRNLVNLLKEQQEL